MRTANEHLRRYPSARSSTLSWIEMRNQRLEELRQENRKRNNRFIRRLWKLLLRKI